MSIKDFLPAPGETDEIIKTAAENTANHIRYIQDKKTLVESLIYAWDQTIDPNGYQLARILDDECGYDIDTAFVDDLDNMQWEVDKLVKEAREQWIIQNNIQPELEIGTILYRIPLGPGTIVGIYEHAAGYYLVQRDCDNDNSKLLVKFEDALKG